MRAKHSSKYGRKTKKRKKVATFFCVLHCARESDCKTSIEQRNTTKKSRSGSKTSIHKNTTKISRSESKTFIHLTEKYNKKVDLAAKKSCN